MADTDWKEGFLENTLDEGREMEKNGWVTEKNFIPSISYFAGKVKDGSQKYNPKVIMSGNLGSFIFSCNCAFGKHGRKCVHEAALVFAAEKEYPKIFLSKKKEEKQKKDFDFSTFDDKDLFFPISKIFSDHIVIDEEIWNKAGEILEKGEAKSTVDTSWNYEPKELCLIGKVEYQGEGSTVAIAKEGIISMDCSGEKGECRQSRVYSYGYGRQYVSPFSYAAADKRLCLHKALAVRALTDYIKANNPDESTNYAAESLIFSIMKNRKVFVPDEPTEEVKAEVNTEPVDILPVYDPEREELSFSIGRRKYYKVKNLSIFLSNFQNKNTVIFGKDLIVDFSSSLFTDRFMAVLNFLVTLDRYYWSGSGKLQIDSNSDIVSNFFSFCESTEVRTPSSLRFRAEKRDAKVSASFSTLIGRNGKKEIKVILEYPVATRKRQFCYAIEKDAIVRYDLTSLGPLADFFPSSKSGTVEFIFGEKDFPVFYGTVLPSLDKVVEVDKDQLPEYGKWENVKRNYHFLLDYEKDRVSCRVEVLKGTESQGFLSSDKKLIGEDDWVVRQVKVFFPGFDSLRTEWYLEEEKEDALFSLLQDGINVFLEMGEVSISESLKRISVRQIPPIFMSASLTDSLLNLEIESKDIPKKELLKILDSYRRRKKYHRLKDGSFLMLNDNLSGVDTLVNEMSITQKELSSDVIQLPRYRALYLDSLIEKSEGALSLDKDKAFRRMVKDFKSFEVSNHELPSSLESIMRPYQKDGFRWLSTLTDYGLGGILADEMGLGKTLQIISLILSLKERGESGTCLVVSPSSLIYNWEAELRKFAPGLKSVVCAGSPKNRKMILCSLGGVDVLITSYELLKRDIDTYRLRRFLLFVIDEAQYIKNNNTEASKAVKLLSAKYRMALTGTPIENRLSELWSIFDFLMPGFLYSHERFKTEIEIPAMKDTSSTSLDRLRRMTGPFIMRRLKKDVLKELPEKLEEISLSEMEEEQRMLYDAIVLKVRKNIEDTEEKEFKTHKLAILSELMKIREICCDPALLYENYNGKSAKLESLMDLLERAMDEGHRMLIFSQFTSMLERIEKRFNGNIPYLKITGATPKQERLELVDRFNSDSSIPVFLISLKAGGTGLNLTGADMVIHYDPWWNVAVQNQATDRAHRIGQTKVVTVYKLIAKNTIEERIVELQEAKKDLAEKILSGNENSLASLSREELLEILS